MKHSPEERFHDALESLRTQRSGAPDPRFVDHLESRLQFSQQPMKIFLHKLFARRAVSATLLATLVLLIGAAAWWRFGFSAGHRGEPLFRKLLIQGAQAQEHFTLMPTESDSLGVATTTSFRLKSVTDVSCDDVAASLAISPDLTVKVKTVSATECELTPSKPLEAGALYKIVLGATVQTSAGEAKHLFQWAYQAKNEPRVVSTLPRDKAAGVPIDTGIDITLNTDRIRTIDDFFSIDPTTRGRLEKHGRVWSFVPEERLLEGTLYTITVKKGLPVQDSSVTLADDAIVRFETSATGSQNNAYTAPFSLAFTSVRPQEAPVIDFSYTTPPSDLKATVFAFDSADAMIDRMKKVDAIPAWAYYSRQNASISTDGLRKVGEFSLANEANVVRFPSGFEKGFYLVQMTVGGHTLQTPLVVSDLNASLTLTRTKAVVWLYDLTTNKPLANAIVTTSIDQARGTTDGDGVAQVLTPSALAPSSQDALEMSRAYFRVKANDGRETILPAVPQVPWSYGLMTYGGVTQKSSDFWTYLWTDRTLYRPSDSLNVWGVMKRREAPKKERVDFEVWTWNYVDANGDYIPVATGTADTSDFSTYQTTIPLRSLTPGYYTLSAKVDGIQIANRSFEVRTFQKPAYQIIAAANKVAIIEGDEVRYDIQTQFFDGTPAPHIALRYGGYGRAGDAGTDITTNDDGKATLTRKPSYGDGGRQYPSTETLTFFPRDAAEGDISVASSIMIYPSAVMFDPDLHQNTTQVDVDFTLYDVDLTKVISPWQAYGGYSPNAASAQGNPVPNGRIEGNVYEIVTTKTKQGTHYDFLEKKVVDDYYYQTHNEQREAFTGATDDKGYFKHTFTLKSGMFLIDIAAKDSKGRKIVRSVWVSTDSKQNPNPNTLHYSVRDTKNINQGTYNPSTQAVKYRVGDTTSIQFLKDGAPVGATGSFLFLKLQNGVQDAKVVLDSTLPVTFSDRDVPNVDYTAVWFNKGQFYAPTSWDFAQLRFDEESRRLTVTATPEKASYAPGETAKVKVTTKNADGKAVKAMVNLSAIDAALTTIQSDNPPVPLTSIYTSVDAGLLQQYVSHAPLALESGAEGGGGGDGERKNFLDAVLFREVETNGNGEASVSFALPDNITSWRVTAQAVTKDLLAGDTVIGLPVTKSLFATLTMNDDYVIGDQPTLIARAYGSSLHSGQDVTMIFAIPDLNIKETRTVKAYAAERFRLSTLVAGAHEAKLTVKRGSASDTLVRTLNVLPSRLIKASSSSAEVTSGMTFTSPGDARSTLVFSDAGRGRVILTLESLQWSYGKRLDRSLAAAAAADLLAQLDTKIPRSDASFVPTAFQQDDGGISLVTYGGSELRLSAFAAARSDLFNHAKLRDYFIQRLTKKNASLEELGYSLLGLAHLGEAVLPDLQSYLTLDGIADEQRLIAALAFQSLGANDQAYPIVQQLLKKYGETQDPYIRLNLGKTNDEKIVHTAEIAILAEGLKMDERKGLGEFLAANFPKDTLTNLERVLAMDAAIPNLDDVAATFRYRLGGKETAVNFKDQPAYPLSLTPAEVKELSITDVQGPVAVTQTSLEPIDTATTPRDTRLTVNRTYSIYGGEKRPIQEGDIVQITIAPKVAKGVIDHSFLVTDELPSGLVLLSNPWERGISFDQDQGYPIEVSGQRVIFWTGGQRSFHYYARVLTPGAYSAEPAILQGETSRDLVNYSGAQTLEIR